MSTPLVSRSEDLRRLLADGYEISVREGHLIVEAVPFVDAEGNLAHGVLVCELNVSGDVTAQPNPHTMYFSGVPHIKKATPIDAIIAAIGPQPPMAGVEPLSYLSTKPASGYYDDYYQKVTQYVRVISGPARSVDASATARTYRAMPEPDESSPFVYLDSASARAGVSDLAQKLAGGPIAIIGLGGTGSYILDLVAKTPVPEIHLWDPDEFMAHNAFRAPGAPSLEELNSRMKKVDYFADRYGAMHRGIVAHPEVIDESTIDALAAASFVFVAIDTSPAKRVIIEWLCERGIPLIDVGIGVSRRGDGLAGILRTTVVAPGGDGGVVDRRISFGDERDDEYDRNVQIADLNALNAALAVLRWKRMHGFYASVQDERNSTYTIAANQMTSSEIV